MRNRKEQLNIRLTPNEIARLKYNCERTGLSISAYVRMLLSGCQPKETPTIEYEQLIKKLSQVYSKLNNGAPAAEVPELRQVILQLQAAVTLPEKIQG
jgi:hypothetical protein